MSGATESMKRASFEVNKLLTEAVKMMIQLTVGYRLMNPGKVIVLPGFTYSKVIDAAVLSGLSNMAKKGRDEQ